MVSKEFKENLKLFALVYMCFALHANVTRQDEIKELLKIEIAKERIEVENVKQKIIKNEITETIDFVHNANRVQRDSLRAIYNPR